MAERFAGVCVVMVGRDQIPLRGDLLISPTSFKRTGRMGQKEFAGYTEEPLVPFIELRVSTLPQVDIEALAAGRDTTVIAQAANGKQYSLAHAYCTGGFEVNPIDGSATIRWEGIDCHITNI